MPTFGGFGADKWNLVLRCLNFCLDCYFVWFDVGFV